MALPFPPTAHNDELVLRPTREPPSPAQLREGLGRAPVAFLFGLQPSRPPLSYYARRERAAAAAAEAGASPFLSNSTAATGGPGAGRRRPRPFSQEDGDEEGRFHPPPPPPPPPPQYGWGGGWGDEEEEEEKEPKLPRQEQERYQQRHPFPAAAATASASSSTGGAFAAGFSPGGQGSGGGGVIHPPIQQQQQQQEKDEREAGAAMVGAMGGSHPPRPPSAPQRPEQPQGSASASIWPRPSSRGEGGGGGGGGGVSRDVWRLNARQPTPPQQAPFPAAGGGFSLGATFELAAQQKRRQQEQQATTTGRGSKKKKDGSSGKRPSSTGSAGSTGSGKRAKGGKENEASSGSGAAAASNAKTPPPPSSRPASKSKGGEKGGGGGEGQPPVLRTVAGVEETRQAVVTGEMLEGLDRACENVGSDRGHLERFLERCQQAGEITLALLFSDLSSSLSTLTTRYCTPKGVCRHWNCTCDRRVRAVERADYTTVIGAVILLNEGGQCNPCFLPLAPSARSKKQKQQPPNATTGDITDSPTAAAAHSPGCTLPLREMASSTERWQALAELMVLASVRKIFFSAQVGLMPFVAWLISRDQAFPSYLANIVDPRVAAWLLDASLKESDLEHKALLARVIVDPSALPPPAPLDAGAVGGLATKAIRALIEALKATQAMWAALHAQLRQRPQVSALFFETEMRVLPLLASMEVHGVGFDTPAVPALRAQLLAKQQALQQEVFALLAAAGGGAGAATGEFNIDSPEQVAYVLYNKLRLPAPPLSEPGKSKHASTSEDALLSLQHRHPIVPFILRHRALAKALHTYIEPLPLHATPRGALHRYRPFPVVQTAGPRLHAQWNQCQVVTGRLSSSKPALQTIPKAQEVEGVQVRVRSFLRAHASTLMVAADYSQIEMRILAAACKDPGMARLFQQQEGDIYRLLMSNIKRKPPQAVTEAERDIGKTIALGVIYGLGPAAAAKRLGISQQEAEALIRQFLQAYPRIQTFMGETKAFARRHGHVLTLLGRPRPVPNIRSEIPAVRSQAERQAVNGVIQGTAADLMKAAMIIVQRAIDHAWSQGEMAGASAGTDGADGLPPLLSRPTLVMQVHDELVFECPVDEHSVLALKDILRRCMEEEVTASFPGCFGSVPLTVKLAVGKTLGEMRTIPLR